MPVSRRLAWLVTALATLAILLATLHSARSIPPGGWTLALTSGREALAELIQNLLLFIPLGVGLAMVGLRPALAILLGATLSFSVEFAQQWIPGRDPSLGDIICNTASTAIGVALVRTFDRWRRTPPLLATAVTLCLWLGTALLLAHPRRARALTFTWLERGRHTLGEGWQLIFHPDTFSRPLYTLLNATWIAVWMCLVGYLSKGRGPAGMAAVALAVLGLVVIPPLTGLYWSPAEWAGAGIGLGVALALHNLKPFRDRV